MLRVLLRGEPSSMPLPVSTARPRATPRPRASVKVRFCASIATSGRVKKYATNKSSRVDRPRKKAKPRTGPTVRKYSSAGADEARDVGREDRLVRLGEAAVHRTADRLAGLDLVLESFEEHDVGVDGDADRHDDAGGTCQRQREAVVRAEVADDRPQQRGRHDEAEHHDDAEGPVVEDHVEQHEAEADERRR